MQLPLKHTAGDFVIQVIRSLNVFANQVLIMQHLTSLSLVSVTYIEKKGPFWKKKKALRVHNSSTMCMFAQG